MNQGTTAARLGGVPVPAVVIHGAAGEVTINVGGEREDGRAFFGNDTVRVIHPP